MKKAILSAIAVAGLASAAGADIEITEVYVGIDGEDGTADWFEITWTGVGTFDTSTLFFDDESADINDAGQLDSFILSAGESAVFLESDDAGDLAEFAGVWGTGGNVGLANGGGGLSQGGDAVNLMDAGGTVIEMVNTINGHTEVSPGVHATFQYDVAGNQSDSMLGVDGAYMSFTFIDDDDASVRSLIGSPAGIPAPGALAVLGLGGLAATRRRR